MSKATAEKVTRAARLRWVPIVKMRVSPLAQRELNQARVDHLAAEFDLEQLGNPTVNERDGAFYVLDGQHRIEALRQMGWGDQQVQCWTYTDLSDEEMAETFLKLNDYLTVSAYDKFTKSVVAGRAVEVDIDRIVRAQGLCVSRDHLPGAIGAVGTLKRLYNRADGPTLGRTLRIIRDAYGDPGLEAPIIDGIGLLTQRYNGELDETVAVERLRSAAGGSGGLMNKAHQLRAKFGTSLNHCVAAAAVDTINRGKGGKKLPTWWKQGD